MLDEWLRLGVARLDDDGFVHLTTDMFIAQEGFEEKVYYFGHNLHDHAQAAVSNVLGQQTSFLERCVHYDNLTMGSIDEIGALAEKQGMKTLREINKLADSQAQKNENDPQANMRMTFGVYYYYEPMNADDKK